MSGGFSVLPEFFCAQPILHFISRSRSRSFSKEDLFCCGDCCDANQEIEGAVTQSEGVCRVLLAGLIWPPPVYPSVRPSGAGTYPTYPACTSASRLKYNQDEVSPSCALGGLILVTLATAKAFAPTEFPTLSIPVPLLQVNAPGVNTMMGVVTQTVMPRGSEGMIGDNGPMYLSGWCREPSSVPRANTS